VNQNSEVIAGGDVFVWGSLRGDVVAGSKGDQRAKIFSLDFRPSSVVIGGVRRANPASESRAAGATSRATGVPQVAEVIEGRGVGVMTNAVRTSAHDTESGRAEKKAGGSS
jgi:septum formation inhibitor MinC